MSSGYSGDIAKAKIMGLTRNQVITQPQFIQCINVCTSKEELLFLIMGFFDKVHQNPELIKEIKTIQNHMVNLKYE